MPSRYGTACGRPGRTPVELCCWENKRQCGLLPESIVYPHAAPTGGAESSLGLIVALVFDSHIQLLMFQTRTSGLRRSLKWISVWALTFFRWSVWVRRSQTWVGVIENNQLLCTRSDFIANMSTNKYFSISTIHLMVYMSNIMHVTFQT